VIARQHVSRDSAPGGGVPHAAVVGVPRGAPLGATRFPASIQVPRGGQAGGQKRHAPHSCESRAVLTEDDTPRGETEFDETPECSHNDRMERNLVGARELKARLGRYLRRVREGRTVVVTERGQPVAELRPLPADSSADAVLARLMAMGAVTRVSDKPLAPFRPVENRGGSATAAVLEDREDRF
jgi:prevent-host-death family protein